MAHAKDGRESGRASVRMLESSNVVLNYAWRTLRMWREGRVSFGFGEGGYGSPCVAGDSDRFDVVGLF